MPEFLRDISSSVSHGCRYGNPFIAVIPGRAKREPGIHKPRSGVWIPGLRQEAHPGMTLEAIPAT
jgi:hypothetical protein